MECPVFRIKWRIWVSHFGREILAQHYLTTRVTIGEHYLTTRVTRVEHYLTRATRVEHYLTTIGSLGWSTI